MSPKATVIISTYNWSSVLPYSVGSVVEQTVDDLQILVVGDGCTDDSGKVVRSIGDSRVKWINLEERWGHQSAPNNEGIRRAEAPFIFYLGHDDLWLPHHVESFLEVFERGADVVYGMLARVDGHGTVEVIPPARPWQRGLPVPPSGFAHRKELVELVGGWRDYRVTEWPPEYDLLNRFSDAGAEFMPCRRISGIKFPAAERPGIYKSGDVSEQREWLHRIRNESTLEIQLMGQMIEDLERRYGPKPLPVEAQQFFRTVRERIAKRFRARKVPVEQIDRSKKRKGSD